jgi:hypothetical protein
MEHPLAQFLALVHAKQGDLLYHQENLHSAMGAARVEQVP